MIACTSTYTGSWKTVTVIYVRAPKFMSQYVRAKGFSWRPKKFENNVGEIQHSSSNLMFGFVLLQCTVLGRNRSSSTFYVSPSFIPRAFSSMAWKWNEALFMCSNARERPKVFPSLEGPNEIPLFCFIRRGRGGGEGSNLPQMKLLPLLTPPSFTSQPGHRTKEKKGSCNICDTMFQRSRNLLLVRNKGKIP